MRLKAVASNLFLILYNSERERHGRNLMIIMFNNVNPTGKRRRIPSDSQQNKKKNGMNY